MAQKYTVQRTLTENIEVEADSATDAYVSAINAELFNWQIVDGPEYRIYKGDDETVTDEDWEYPV